MTSLAIALADLDAGPVDREVRVRVATRAAVGEVDDRVHRPWPVGGVGVGQVDGQAMVERDAALGHFDEDRLDAGDLGIAEDVLGLTEEDVHELAQADGVRARGGTPIAPDVERRALEGDPRRDRVRLLDRPVRVVLVGVGGPAAGLLVEGLVVPQPNGVDPSSSAAAWARRGWKVTGRTSG